MRSEGEQEEWLPAAVIFRRLEACVGEAELEALLLERLRTGKLSAIADSSSHTQGKTSFYSNGSTSIPPEEWQFYLPVVSSLVNGDVQMRWTPRVALPIVGLSEVTVRYTGVRFRLSDVAALDLGRGMASCPRDDAEAGTGQSASGSGKSEKKISCISTPSVQRGSGKTGE